MIIGISGKIGSGKDLTGKIIQILTTFPRMFNERVMQHLDKELANSPFKIKKFADSLKDMVCLLLGCTRERLEEREFKESVLGEEWWVWVNFDKTMIYAYTGQKMDPEYWTLQKTTPRTLLQLLGTECGREILHPNVWVNALMSKYVPTGIKTTVSSEMIEHLSNRQDDKYLINPFEAIYPKWIITDMRFPNELEAVEKKGGITIRVNRSKATESVEHESETALDKAEFKYTLENNGSIKDLVDKIREILKIENII
jgi:hypothetical protein